MGDAAPEGRVDAPGGALSYRVREAEPSSPTLLFENGWGASFPSWANVEAALAGAGRMVFYDRAGTGESTATRRPDAAGMTEDALALLDHVGVDGPVVVVGHSYGGLIATLHAAQAGSRVSAVVQLDPFPQYPDARLDREVGLNRLVMHAAVVGASLHVPSPLTPGIRRALPADAAERMLRATVRSAGSLRGSLAELDVMGAVRDAVNASPTAARVPRLVITGEGYRRPSTVRERMARSHRRQASLSDESSWRGLPYTHIGLIFAPGGPEAVAAEIRPFLEEHA